MDDKFTKSFKEHPLTKEVLQDKYDKVEAKRKKFMYVQYVLLAVVVLFRMLYFANHQDYPVGWAWLQIPDFTLTIVLLVVIFKGIQLNTYSNKLYSLLHPETDDINEEKKYANRDY